MKFRLFLSALLLSVAMVGCSDNPLDESVNGGEGGVATRKLTIDVGTGVDARMSVVPNDDNSKWAFGWEDTDKLAGWGDTGYVSEFSIVEFSESSDNQGFEGLMDEDSKEVRFIYPYDPSLPIVNGTATFDLSSQTINVEDGVYDSMGENNLFMACPYYTFAGQDTAVVLIHLFTYLELDIKATDLTSESLVVEKIEIDGLAPSSATMEFSKSFVVGGDNDKITIDVENASALTDDGLVIPVVAVPFTIAEGQEATVTLYFTDGSSVVIEKNYTMPVDDGTGNEDANKGGNEGVSYSRADIPVAGQEYVKGKYNTVNAHFSVSEIEGGTPDDNKDYLSDFAVNTSESTTFVPEGDTWTIYTSDDNELTYTDFEGLKYAIAAANGSDPVVSPTIIFADLVSVPDNAFYNHTEALDPDVYRSEALSFSVELPVATSIGVAAFWGSRNLVAISDLDKVETICGNAFRNCSALEMMDIPNVTSIGGGGSSGSAFRGLSLVETMDLPKLETLVGSYNFGGMSKLLTLSMPMITEIGSNTYYNVKLNTYVLGSESYPVTTISKSAFNVNGTVGENVSPTSAALTITAAEASLCNYTISNNILTLYSDAAKSDETPVEITFKTINGEGAAVVDGEFNLADINDSTAVPQSQTWTIKDSTVAAVSADNDVFAGLRTLIKKAQRYGVGLDEGPIIEFPNVTGKFSDYAFNVATTIKPHDDTFGGYKFSVNLPEAITVGQSTFDGADLVSISAPKANQVAYGSFKDTKLTTLYLPVVTEISNMAFCNTTTLTSISLGTEGDGVKAFLKNPTATSDDAAANTWGDTVLEIKLAESSTASIDANVITWASGYVTTFKTINGVGAATGDPKPDTAYNLSDFATMTAAPESNEWEIWDTTASSADDFAGLRDAIKSYSSSYGDKEIVVKFTNLTSIPNNAFSAYKGYDTEFEGHRFSVEFPALETIGTGVFYNASLTAVSAPELTIANTTCFRGTKITTLDLPKVTELGNNFIHSCASLTSLSLGTGGDGVSVTTNAADPFGNNKADYWQDNVTLTIKIVEGTDSNISIADNVISYTVKENKAMSATFKSITKAE